MERSTRCIADPLWNGLVRAWKELGYLPTDGSGVCPQYDRLVFNEKYNLLTFEVNRGRFLNFPDHSSVRSEDMDRMRGYFKNIRLDVVDLGPNLYFNFWIGSIGQILPANRVHA